MSPLSQKIAVVNSSSFYLFVGICSVADYNLTLVDVVVVVVVVAGQFHNGITRECYELIPNV